MYHASEIGQGMGNEKAAQVLERILDGESVTLRATWPNAPIFTVRHLRARDCGTLRTYSLRVPGATAERIGRTDTQATDWLAGLEAAQ